MLTAHGARLDKIRLHVVPTDRVWLRDSAPIGVHDSSGQVVLLDWKFNGWAKYDNWKLDDRVGPAVASITGLRREEPARDNGERIVLEGGGIDTNGDGLMLVTEEWLLSNVQVRNPGLTRTDYEQIFAKWFGIDQTIWLGEGCVGDDTHGHIDDIARFVAKDTVVLAVEPDPNDENHERSMDNLHRLERASKAPGVAALHIVTLPFPRAVVMDGERLPASYANFYLANDVVLVPTFNDANDRVALDILSNLMPSRTVIGIHAVDLVWGLGTLHCLTQQEPQSTNS
jgi:agmatine deiminase